MNIRQCKSPQWSNPEHSAIDVQVEWAERLGMIMPFTASRDDVAVHGRELFDRIISGEFGEVKEFGI